MIGYPLHRPIVWRKQGYFFPPQWWETAFSSFPPGFGKWWENKEFSHQGPKYGGELFDDFLPGSEIYGEILQKKIGACGGLLKKPGFCRVLELFLL